MIVNAPMLFSGVYGMVKGWLDEETRKKIQILGGSYSKELLKYVDKDQLPDFLGGTNDAQLIEDRGPWNEYQIVDGHKAGDIVGVKKINDPNAEIFTPEDFEYLPNYIIDGKNLDAMPPREPKQQ